MGGWSAGLPIIPGSGSNSPDAPPSTPLITNITTFIAGVEYSFAFPPNTKHFTIKARNNGKIQLSFVSEQSGTNFITISPGSVRWFGNILMSAQTIYFQSSKAGEVIEIESWS
jgi:hypothetical protein